MSSTALVNVTFEGVQLDLVRLAGAGGAVSLRRLSESLGLDPDGQLNRVRRAESAGELWACTSIMEVQIPGDDQRRDVVFLPISSIPMWAMGIQPSRVSTDLRPLLIAYRNKAAEVLARALFESGSAEQRRAELLPRFERTRRMWEATQRQRTREQLLVEEAISTSDNGALSLAIDFGVTEIKVHDWRLGAAMPTAKQVARLLEIVGKQRINQVLLPSEEPAPADVGALELATLGMERDLEPDAEKRALLEQRIEALLLPEYLAAPADPQLEGRAPTEPKRLA